MNSVRRIAMLGVCILPLAGCGNFGSGPPPIRPAAFTALGVSAAYLNGDLIGGSRARAAKMRAAKIRRAGLPGSLAARVEAGI